MIREQGRGDGGCIEVITGGMFSGKSEELLRRLRRALIARQRVQVFRIVTDTRDGEVDVLTTPGQSEPVRGDGGFQRRDAREADTGRGGRRASTRLSSSMLGLVGLATELADLGVRVIVAGLDLDFRRRPFGPIPELMAIAEYVDKMHAVCVRCGAAAQYSLRIAGG